MFDAPPSTTKIIVRRAREPEAGVVLKLYVDYLFPIANFKPDIERAAAFIYQMVKRGQVFVAVRYDEIIGLIAYTVMRPWYMAEDQIWEQGGVVIPKYRKGPATARMMAALRNEGRRLKMDVVMVTNTNSDESPRMLRKRYRKISEGYVMECR